MKTPSLGSLEGFNEAQRDAIQTSKGHLLILAGPGTGKTRVLVTKVFKLIEEGLAPERILAITFSKRATHETIERLEKIQPGVTERLEVSTLHSWCIQLVEKHGFRLGFNKKPRLMSEAEAQVYFRKVSQKLNLHLLLKTSYIEPVLEELMNFFADAKDEGLWPEDIIRFANQMDESDEASMARKREWLALGDIYNAYQSHSFSDGLMDFGDAVLCALRILKDFPQVSEEVQSKYASILVDEFQDTNWSQIQLLRLIASKDAHIAVVGDDDQSIYKFRGASYSAFTFFKEVFDPVKIIDLNSTYRLPPSVVEVSSALISANGDRRFKPDKKITSLKDHEGPVQFIRAQSFEQEADWISKQIRQLIEQGSPAREIGVLVRGHSHGTPIYEALQAQGVPVSTSSNRSLIKEPLIQDLLAYLKLLVDPNDSLALFRLFSSPIINLDPQQIYTFCRWRSKLEGPFIDQLKELKDSRLSESAQKALCQFHLAFEQIFATTAHQSISQILSKIYETSDLISKFINSNPQQLRILGKFHSQISEWEKSLDEPNLRTSLPLLEALIDLQVPVDPDHSSDENAVSILTMHASKGLEFDYVFIPCLVGRRMPANFRQSLWMVPDPMRKESAPTKQTHLDEERRLLYVAMTRAKKRLFLSAVERKGVKVSTFITEDLKDVFEKCEVWHELDLPPLPEHLPTLVTKSKSAFKILDIPELTKEKKPLSLSYTQLEKYETCPLSYQFKYDFQIPVETPAHMTIGSCVHEALEKLFVDIKQERPPTRENLMKYFDESIRLQKQIYPKMGDQQIQHARTKLGEYYDSYSGKFPYPHAVEENFVLQLGPHKVRGKIDRIDRLNDGYRIIDYKTGKAKSEAADPKKAQEARKSLQFSIYALAARDALKLDVKEMVFEYVYHNQSLSTSRTDEELADARKQILELAQNIQDRKFDPKPGNYCQWCEYAAICPAKKES